MILRFTGLQRNLWREKAFGREARTILALFVSRATCFELYREIERLLQVCRLYAQMGRF